MGGEVVAASTAGEALLADAAGATIASEAALGAGAGAGFLEGMAGVSALEGAGVAGLGLGTGAGLAGGLGSLAPAFQTALGETAVFNPEIASQVAQFANVGAVPNASAALGAGQIGDPALLQGVGDVAARAYDPSLLQNVNATMDLDIRPDQIVDSAEPVTRSVASVVPPTGPLPVDPQAYDLGQSQIADLYGKNMVSPPSSSPFTSPFTTAYNAFKSLDKPTQYGLGGIGALQAAKYLNRQPGVAPIPGYSGPLSKFTYNPNTYTPYTYKPYAAGGPVEEMSRENAMGANTGYPQADIRQGAYATPWQTPVSRNVVAGADDANLDIMTGAERMAEGGEASSDAGDTGIAALGPMMYSPSMMSSSLVDPAEAYAAAQPMMDMSRQNFQDFLARYQNLPITEAAPAPVTYTGLYAGEGPKPVEVPYDPGWGGYSGAGGGRVSPDGFGGGGISNLGSYSDGGRLLKGPGDGMSDNIPANISGKQPARLADGEFVVPADVVSGLGNGSTDAGAKQLYKMLDKVRAARTGTKKQGKQIKPEKYTPA